MDKDKRHHPFTYLIVFAMILTAVLAIVFMNH